MEQDTKQTHVSDEKKKIVSKLEELMKKKTVMLVSIKNLPSAQFQDIKKKLRNKAIVKVVKKSLVDFALKHAKDATLKELIKYVQENCAILFSDEDAFEISSFLADSKSSAKAKPGQEALEEIKIEAGPTDLIPGPDISALSSVGLQVKVENGKIAIQKAHVLIKKGEVINKEKAGVLAKLDITPFKIGLEPIAAFYEGKVYEDIKIDKESTLEELKEKSGRCLAFAVSLNYLIIETIPYILGKAAAHENALKELIKEEEPLEEKKVENEEVKKEAEEEKTKEKENKEEKKENKSNSN